MSCGWENRRLADRRLPAPAPLPPSGRRAARLRPSVALCDRDRRSAVICSSSPLSTRRVVAALPLGRSVTLDTGHEVHEADPDGFTRAVAAFLKTLRDLPQRS